MDYCRKPGVLNKNGLEKCFEQKWVSPPPENELKADASAIDLEIGGSYWELSASVRPGKGETVEKAISVVEREKGLVATEGLRLEPECIYLFKAKQRLRLPMIMTGRSTGRSSVGRIDVLTRLLCDQNSKFDEVPAGYSGPLYVEVIPNSLPILVRPGMVLNQLRLFWGRPDEALLTLREAMWCAESGTVIVRPDEHFHGEELEAHSLQLSVNLRPLGSNGVAAYVVRKNSPERLGRSGRRHVQGL